MDAVKMKILNSNGKKQKIFYQMVPENYFDFIKLCEKYEILNYSKFWIDQDNEHVEITDENSFLMFLKCAPLKKIVLFIKNDQLKGENENKIIVCIKNEIKNDNCNSNNDEDTLQQNVSDNLEKTIQPELKINNSTTEIVAKILRNFNDILPKILMIYNEETDELLQETILKVLKNFDEQLSKIIALCSLVAAENEKDSLDELNQTVNENTFSPPQSINDNCERNDPGPSDENEDSNNLLGNESEKKRSEKKISYSQLSLQIRDRAKQFAKLNSAKIPPEDTRLRSALSNLIMMGFDWNDDLPAITKANNYDIGKIIDVLTDKETKSSENDTKNQNKDVIKFDNLDID